jgi:hypothetical protein
MIQLSKLTKLAVAMAAVTTMSFTAQATVTFTLASSGLMGSVTAGTETPTVSNAEYVNSIVDRNNNDTTTSSYDHVGQAYALIHDSGTTLPWAVVDGATTGAVGGNRLVTVTGFEYLVVKYDGEQGSALIFNVADITGDVQVPNNDFEGKTPNKYLLFNAASTPPPSVPDGGATVALLGVGSLALAALRRKP